MAILWQVVILVGIFPFLDSKTLSLQETTTLNRFMGEVARCARVPAISLSLVRDGQIVYTHGFGTSNKQRNQYATSKTVFCLGDITQTFTATLLSKLLDAHENYTWDTPVQEILGAGVNFGDRFRNEFLSLRDILSMRTGLGNMDGVIMTNAMDRYRLIRNLRFAPRLATFREKFVHNNLLFVLAEEVVRTLGRDTWYKLLGDHLLRPLGMANTYFVNTDAKEQENLAVPVMSYNGAPMNIPMEAMKGQEILAAGSSICSSGEDMAKWLLLNLNRGVTHDGGQLIPSDLMEDLFRSQTTRPEGDAILEGFSQPDIQVSYTRDANTLGWISGQYRGFRVLSQDGSLPGYESLTSIVPDRKVGVFTAFTGDGGAKAYAAKTLVNIYALDLLIHGHPWFSLNNFCTVLDKMVDIVDSGEDASMATGIQQIAESKRPLDDYQGYFRNLGFGDVRVWVNESLYLSYGDMGDYVLRPTNKDDVFIMEARPGPLWYSTHVDTLRVKPSYAFFSTTDYSNERIEEVTIPHFDGQTDPVFSKRVRIPPLYEEERDCNGSAAVVATASLVLTLVVLLL